MATASDVPNRYDVVIDGKGYMFVDSEDIKAQYGYTRTFVERTNTQGDFGDEFQDFWLTADQNDWSLGEDQKFFRKDDETSRSRYWRGTNIDNRIAGQLSMRNKAVQVAIAATVVKSACSAGKESSGQAYVTTATNLYRIDLSGVGSTTVTNDGAHGLGAAPAKWGMVSDGGDAYLTTELAGTVGVRKYTPVAFATFSASPASALAFLNNTLYGYVSATTKLVRWDTAGTRSDLFTWQTSDGGTAAATTDGGVKLVPYGSKLLILRGAVNYGEAQGAGGLSELWIYDGTGTTRLADLPEDFTAFDLTVSYGIAFIPGFFRAAVGSTVYVYQAVLYYANGTIGLLWKSPVGVSASSFHATPICRFEGGLVWPDFATTQYLSWRPDVGGVQRLGALVKSGTRDIMVSGPGSFAALDTADLDIDIFPSASLATSATFTSSSFDFDSSLDKLFRGIRVDWITATDGDGGSVDIAYRVGDLDGSYTTLQTGAVNGTEYTLSGITGRSISVKVTLNKGTSTSGPVLKRVSVRAAPKQTAFQRNSLFINATGRDGESPLQLRDGSLEPRDGLQIANDLRAVAAAGVPVSITTEHGTVTNAVIENDGFDERRIRANEFLIVVPYREV
jgi:hypothetical protein